MIKKIFPVILSGGSGTRLWPLSRSAYPKQFLQLDSNSETLLQKTILRVFDAQRFHAPLIIANYEHRFIVAEQLRSIQIDPLDIILEPCGKNTATAVLMAALRLLENDPNAVMLVLPSDHVIKNNEAFTTGLERGSLALNQSTVVTFGIKPTSPETGYGYICQGEELLNTIFSVKQFVEKPNKIKAEEYLAAGNYSWNSGIFLLKADRYLEKMREFYPKEVKACERSYELAKRDSHFLHLESKSFKEGLDQSIDYAFMERVSDIALVSLDCGWSDIGSWSALFENSMQDALGNVALGDTQLIDVKNSYVRSEGPLVSVVDLDNIVVVATSDAVLVVSKGSTQKIKKITDQLKEHQRQELLTHKKVLRPWGSYQIIDEGTHFQAKRIVVHPGQKLSLQKHQHRAEHWVVVRGRAYVTKGKEEFWLNQNESTYIPLGVIHRLENRETFDLEIIEVQSGDYLSEDDIIRLEDIYDRVSDQDLNLTTVTPEKV